MKIEKILFLKQNHRYKGILPRNSNHPFDEYLRKTVLENHFLLSIIQMLISTTGIRGLRFHEAY